MKVIAIIFKSKNYECRSQIMPYWTNKRKNYATKNICSKCHKFGHLRKNYRTQVPSSNHDHIKGKRKVDIKKKVRR